MAACLDLGQEVAERGLNAITDTVSEWTLERTRVRWDRGDGLDHLVGDVSELRPQNSDNLRRQLVPGLISHDSYRMYKFVTVARQFPRRKLHTQYVSFVTG
jgi:hypothetical protein